MEIRSSRGVAHILKLQNRSCCKRLRAPRLGIRLSRTCQIELEFLQIDITATLDGTLLFQYVRNTAPDEKIDSETMRMRQDVDHRRHSGSLTHFIVIISHRKIYILGRT